MSYYSIENDFDPRTVGCFPQSTEMGCGYEHSRVDSMKFITIDTIPPFIPNIGCFILENKAKLTDFISAAILPCGYIISNKAKAVIETFNIGKHAFFPTKVSAKGHVYENYFWWIIEPEDFKEYIDYDKTSVYIRNGFNEKIRDLNLKSPLDLQLARQQRDVFKEHIHSDAISFTSKLPQNLDLICNPFNYRLYISISFAQAITQANFTGLLIKPSKLFK